ncbi:MAG: oxidoreductase [Rhodococcus sp.]|nr:oxidoreductase [Rhodococcus sp. (in: high G+C Gram-positive bacteria)]
MNIPALQESWRAVVAIGEDAIHYFYSHLFLAHPEVRDMFPISMSAQRDRFFAALGHILTSVETLADDPSFVQHLGKDHRRFGVVSAHYPAAGASLLATLEHFHGDSWTPELAADWAAAYQAVAGLMMDAAADAEKKTPPWWDADVVSIQHRGLDFVIVEIQPRVPYTYQPGQSMAIEVPQRPRQWRYVTPACAPRPDGIIELHIEIVPGGQVSGAIARDLAPGHTVKLGAPIGTRLTIDPDTCGDLVLIAGGSGLAPMRALIQQLDQRWGTSGGAPNVLLFHGAKNRANLYSHDYLTQMSSREWFNYIPVVSEDPTFAGHRGLVGTVAAEMYWWEGYTALVCGSPQMVEHAYGELTRVGLDPESISYEYFSPSAPSEAERTAMPSGTTNTPEVLP